MKRIHITILVLSHVSGIAQSDAPSYKKDNMVWIGYYNNFFISKKWSINSDVQFRTKNWIQTPSQALVGSGLAYSVNKNISLTGGLAHFRYYVNSSVTRGEWRPYEELSLKMETGKIQITNRLRIEERFDQPLENSEPVNNYRFNYRYRHKIDIQFPSFTNKRTVYLSTGNELMLNSGKNITRAFDQNRTYAAFNFEYSRRLLFQVQYMFILQASSTSSLNDRVSVIRFNIYHSIYK
jgi:hypothetical protein